MAYQDVAIFFPKERPITVGELLENAPNELQHSTLYLAIYADDQYSAQNLGHLKEIKTNKIVNIIPNCMPRVD